MGGDKDLLDPSRPGSAGKYTRAAPATYSG